LTVSADRTSLKSTRGVSWPLTFDGHGYPFLASTLGLSPVSKRTAIIAAMQFFATAIVINTHAFASCGDWLSHSHQPDSAPITERELSNAAEDVGGLHTATVPDWPKRPRCNGPRCQQAPSHPATPAAPEVRLAAPESALLNCAARLQSLAHPDSFPSALDAISARGYPSRIDHPPRA
jgi:hypothetical protein